MVLKSNKDGLSDALRRDLIRLLAAEDEFRARLPDGRVLILIRRGKELRSGFGGLLPGEMTDEALTILDSSDPLEIRPILPDRPLVLQPESDLRILPEAGITTAVTLPLGVALTTKGDHRPRTVREFGADAMSKTWFGGSDAGEAAYYRKASLSVRSLPDETGPWEAVCPLTVRNDSPEQLNFKRMILRVTMLSLFSNGKATATNSVTVRFRGQTQVSQVTIGQGPEGLPRPFIELTEPRMPADKTLLRRSFDFIKTISAG